MCQSTALIGNAHTLGLQADSWANIAKEWFDLFYEKKKKKLEENTTQLTLNLVARLRQEKVQRS